VFVYFLFISLFIYLYYIYFCSFSLQDAKYPFKDEMEAGMGSPIKILPFKGSRPIEQTPKALLEVSVQVLGKKIKMK
jgi:hypothetical protein